MKQLSICMTHFNRKTQLLNTLQSIQNQDNAKALTEIIIVDDGSNVPLQLSDFSDLDLDITLVSIQTKNKWWINPCMAFNTAFTFIHAPKVVIQNAECLHATDIIRYALNNVGEHEYVAMSALALTKEATMGMRSDTAIADIDRNGSQWYCHSLHRPKAFHFCAALNTEDLQGVGGFDPRFSEGIYYDDTMFLQALVKHGVSIRIEDSQLVLHQWHEKVWEHIDGFGEKRKRNKQLLAQSQ